MKRHKDLFKHITSYENLFKAYLNTRRGKRSSRTYLEFKEYDMHNLKCIQQDMKSGQYEMGEYKDFWIQDPKHRLISALPFRDRVVQHAINNVLEPIFDAAMLPYTFACRQGKGTHAGVKHIQASLRKHECTHFLKVDMRQYFPSTWRPGLYRKIDRKIGCRETLRLLEKIVPREGTGIRIGSLSSQLHANVNGTTIDDLVHNAIKPDAWARYMDDVILLDSDPGKLREAKLRIEEIAYREMRMEFSKWSISSVSKGIDFLGYRIWPGYKLLRKQSVQRAKKRIKKIKDPEELARFWAAWTGHARWADVENLIRGMT